MNSAHDTPQNSASGITAPLTPALAAFIASNPRGQETTSGSVLDPYWAEITRLSNDGYSLAKIQEFLKTVGVTISRTGLHSYINKNLK